MRTRVALSRVPVLISEWQSHGWQVKRDGAKRACHVTGTKAEANRLGRRSRNQEMELQVHRKD